VGLKWKRRSHWTPSKYWQLADYSLLPPRYLASHWWSIHDTHWIIV
jgi:hypothetical protein